MKKVKNWERISDRQFSRVLVFLADLCHRADGIGGFGPITSPVRKLAPVLAQSSNQMRYYRWRISPSSQPIKT